MWPTLTALIFHIGTNIVYFEKQFMITITLVQTSPWVLMDRGRLVTKSTIKCLNLSSGIGRGIKKPGFC